MRRLPLPLLTLALVTSTASAAVRADADLAAEAAAEPSPAQADATAPAAPAPAAAVEDKATEKKEEKGETKPAVVNARLAPGGVLAADEDSFPLHAQATLDTFAGQGFYAHGFQAQPLLGSSLSVRMSAQLPKVFDKALRLSAGTDFSVANWLAAYTNSGVYERQVRVSDFSVGLIVPAAFTEEFTGISATPVLSLRLPLSINSRHTSLLTSAGGSVTVSWNSPETPVGSFNVQYVPSVRGNIYTQVVSSIPCEARVQENELVANPLEAGHTPLAYGVESAVLENGECALAGRQGLVSVGNSGSLSWMLAEHSVSVSLGHTIGFLRELGPLPPGASVSEHASAQNFRETTSGSLSYTYSVPVDFSLQLTAGIASQQAPYTPTGQLRFPFYDFLTPANNFSAAFFDVTVGI